MMLGDERYRMKVHFHWLKNGFESMEQGVRLWDITTALQSSNYLEGENLAQVGLRYVTTNTGKQCRTSSSLTADALDIFLSLAYV